MTFVPPVGAGTPPVVAVANPVAADAPGSDKSIQALYDSISYPAIQGEVFSSTEFLGPVGSAMLRDFLGGAKREADKRAQGFNLFNKTGQTGGLGGDVEPQKHAGPGVEAFRGEDATASSDDESAKKIDQMVTSLMETFDFNMEAKFVISGVQQVTQGVNQLIKGQ